MKTVFFGSSEYVIPILEVLKDRFGFSLILTTEKQGSVVEFARANNIPYIQVNSFSQNTKYKIQNTNADVGIVANFGLIIPRGVTNLFPKGVLNVHPSLLPKYRGSTPAQSTILSDDKETGVTIFKIDEKIDHGPILAAEEFEISDDETTHSLHTALFKLGANLLEKTLIDYIEDVLDPVPQDEKNASFTKLLSKQDGFVDINKPPSKEKLDRMIRAYYPWPGVWFKAQINGKQTIIKFLPEQKIQVEGKRVQSYKDFTNGYKEGKEILNKLKL